MRNLRNYLLLIVLVSTSVIAQTKEEKKEIIELLKTYKYTFNTIVQIDTEIGIDNKSGLARKGMQLR